MNGDRWTAGARLMEAQSPEAWRVLMDAEKLTRDNQAALAACREAATKTKKINFAQSWWRRRKNSDEPTPVSNMT